MVPILRFRVGLRNEALLAVPIAGVISVILNDLLREKRERERRHDEWRPGDRLRQAWRGRRTGAETVPNVAGTRANAGEQASPAHTVRT